MNFNLDLSFLREWQKHFFEHHKLRNVLVVHRRWGKTIVAIVFLLYKALINKWSYWYIAPYRSQAKQIAWEALLKICENIPWVEKNVSELKATLPNWSTITLFGADNQEALRWLDLRWVILDEYKDISSSLYSEIIAPMVNAYKDGWVTYIWTPWGKNQFYDIYQRAIKNPEDWYSAYLDIYTTGLLDEEQLARAKEEGTDELGDDSAFRQEYLLDWDVSAKYSYYGKYISAVFKENRLYDNLFDPELPVYTAWDIWYNDYTCIVFFQYKDEKIRIIDYYQNRTYWFWHYKEVLDEKPYAYRYHFLPHDIMQTELWTWLTRFETFEKMFGWESALVVTRTKVEDWINAVRELLPDMIFDSSLIDYLNKLSEYQPKLDKEGNPWKPIHSDVADTIRYLAMSYNEYIEIEEEYDTVILDYNEYL